jgi:hypothetical protein
MSRKNRKRYPRKDGHQSGVDASLANLINKDASLYIRTPAESMPLLKVDDVHYVMPVQHFKHMMETHPHFAILHTWHLGGHVNSVDTGQILFTVAALKHPHGGYTGEVIAVPVSVLCPWVGTTEQPVDLAGHVIWGTALERRNIDEVPRTVDAAVHFVRTELKCWGEKLMENLPPISSFRIIQRPSGTLELCVGPREQLNAASLS